MMVVVGGEFGSLLALLLSHGSIHHPIDLPPTHSLTPPSPPSHHRKENAAGRSVLKSPRVRLSPLVKPRVPQACSPSSPTPKQKKQ